MTLDRIIQLMEKTGITNKIIAEKLGVNQQIVTDWKNGKSKSYKKYLYQLAEILGVSVEYLKGETEQKEKAPTPKGVSASDMELLAAYHAKPEMQEAVNKLLGLDKPQSTPFRGRLVAKGGLNLGTLDDEDEPRHT